MGVSKSWVSNLEYVKDYFISTGKLDQGFEYLNRDIVMGFIGNHEASSLYKLYSSLQIYFAKLDELNSALRGGFFRKPNQKEAERVIDEAIIALNIIGKEMKSAVSRGKV